MTFNINNIPSVIQGTDMRPYFYGKTAQEQQQGYLQAVQTAFQNGNQAPLDTFTQSSTRFTPEGTLSKGALTEESIQNALGFAKAEIKQYDEDGDGALSKQEVLKIYLSPFEAELNKTASIMQNTQQGSAEYNQAESLHNLYFNFAINKAANYLSSVDVRDPNTGVGDQVITADESAAKLLFDDAAKQMFEDNSSAYQTIMDALQSKAPDYAGPSFAQLQEQVQTTVGNHPNSPFVQDGQVSAGESELGDLLTAAPIPTNEIVSSIHQTLNLKERAAQTPQE